MANIYDLGNSFATLWGLIEDEAVEDEVLLEAFENATDDLKDKLENCCKYIKNVDSDIAGLDEEIKRLQAKKKSLTNGKDRLKGMMLRALNMSGEKKLPCGTFTVYKQANPPKVVIDEQYIENIPEQYLIPQEPVINKALILEALKESNIIHPELDGIAHIEQGESLRIK